MNKLIIIGNLTRDPEGRSTQSGVQVCTFTVAVNRPREKDKADFFRVSACRLLADNCLKYLHKGQKVCVIGPVSLNEFTSQSGEKHAQLEVNADEVEFLTRPQTQQAQQEEDELPCG